MLCCCNAAEKKFSDEFPRGGGGCYLKLSSDRDVPHFARKIGSHNSVNSGGF